MPDDQAAPAGAPPRRYRSLLLLDVETSQPGEVTTDLETLVRKITDGTWSGQINPLIWDLPMDGGHMTQMPACHGPSLLAADDSEADRRISIRQRDGQQWWAITGDGTSERGPYPTREDAEQAQEWDLCDDCFEEVTGERAACQDDCNLSLDHDGWCGPYPKGGPVRCQRCGTADRLTHIESQR